MAFKFISQTIFATAMKIGWHHHIYDGANKTIVLKIKKINQFHDHHTIYFEK